MKTETLLRLAPVPAFVWLLAVGCAPSQLDRVDPPSAGTAFLPHPRLTTGTALHVRVRETLSSESASVGDSWRGDTVSPVVVDGDEAIPAGSVVEGVVRSVAPATADGRAMLQIEVQKVLAGEHETTLQATSPPVIAGSQRARNLDAMTGGGAAGTDESREPVVLKSGTVMTFTVSREVAMR